MPKHFQDIKVARATDAAWLLNNIAKNILYATVAIGYLVSILGAAHLTLLNFLVFTLLQICYCTVIWWSIEKDNPSYWWLIFSLSTLSILAILSGFLSANGIYWDWLIYVTTVAIYFQHLELRMAILISFLLWLAVIFNLAFIDQWNWLSSILSSLTVLSAFVFVGVFIYTMKQLFLQRTRSEQLVQRLEESNGELERAHTQLRNYANEVEELTIVRERTRIAREIHDTLGHYLSILNIQLETISRLQERDPARLTSEIAEARHVAAQSMQEVRNAVAALRPTSIARLNLAEALTQLGNEFTYTAKETDLTLDLETRLPTLSPDLQVALYRATQEALTNIRKHAQANKVLVRLRYENEILELLVRDNGNGLLLNKHNPPTSGFGLLGLCERIELLGGQVTAGPAEPAGYRVLIQVKVEPTSTPTPAVNETNIQEESHGSAHSRPDC